MNYDDAFMLEPVAEHLLDNLNFVAGIVPVLTSHIKKVQLCMRPNDSSTNTVIVIFIC